MLRKWIILLTAGLAILLTGASTAGASIPPGTISCPIGQPCASWQDQNTTGVQQDLELFDHNGAPIWWVNNAGGMWVGNDRLGVTGASVFDNAAYLSVKSDGVHGQLTIDGQVLTAADITEIHLLEQAHLTLRDLRWLKTHGG